LLDPHEPTAELPTGVNGKVAAIPSGFDAKEIAKQ
jgi:hypothetical protein